VRGDHIHRLVASTSCGGFDHRFPARETGGGAARAVHPCGASTATVPADPAPCHGPNAGRVRVRGWAAVIGPAAWAWPPTRRVAEDARLW